MYVQNIAADYPQQKFRELLARDLNARYKTIDDSSQITGQNAMVDEGAIVITIIANLPGQRP